LLSLCGIQVSGVFVCFRVCEFALFLFVFLILFFILFLINFFIVFFHVLLFLFSGMAIQIFNLICLYVFWMFVHS